MAKIKDLEKYLNYEFSSGGYTGEDYKKFERLYINYLKSFCEENRWTLIKANKNHYEFSAFLLCDTKYIYLNIGDVRSSNNNWYERILIRTAKNDSDYTGGSNHYSTLPSLKHSIQNLINRG